MSGDLYTKGVTTLGAAAGVACFILLLKPTAKTLAIAVALIIVILGVGIAQYLESAL